MKRIRLVLVVLGIFLPAAAAAQYTPELPDSLRVQADSMMVWLNAGTFANVSAILHYPPKYSKKERVDDEAAVAAGLKIVMGNLGRLVDYGAFSGASVSYEVWMAGGDVKYWDSVSPFRTRDRVYQGVFERFGRGFVVVRFAEIQSRWDAQAVVFWLDPSVAGSRERAIDISFEMARAAAKISGEPVPPNLRELISSSLPDLTGAKR